ncbi:hypothetical protein EW026_g4468 [Hermanssonia centrifuga]|uniref:Uncharacterized protein n=1 Tax=Hermanssonia centrifuga TaxID=98765 RepID=A0A4S4KHC7_9APHY|nr:hypothetical protein EW026_g4468 [Hermanssonia centrifuga]
MDIFFYIDDHMVGIFKDSPPANPDGGIVYDYNVVLYANPSISQPGSHNFTLQNGQIGGSSSLILFDYIIYTRSDNFKHTGLDSNFRIYLTIGILRIYSAILFIILRTHLIVLHISLIIDRS